jgi:uncharacterized membrane protein YdjX (TVP38/TMEM64 family)
MSTPASQKKHWVSVLQSKRVKWTLFIAWIGLILTAMIFYFLHQDNFTPRKIAILLNQYQTTLLLIYFIISMIRGIFLIPSTPFVFAGILLFPDQLFLVFFISLIGVTFSGAFIYQFAHYLEFDRLISKKQKQLVKIKNGINRYGFWIVLVWSFFPIVPTDLICYIASITRMHFWKYLSALFLGEAVLIALYVWFGDTISSYLF